MKNAGKSKSCLCKFSIKQAHIEHGQQEKKFYMESIKERFPIEIVWDFYHTVFLSRTSNCMFSSTFQKEKLLRFSDRLRFPPNIANSSFGNRLSSNSAFADFPLSAFPFLLFMEDLCGDLSRGRGMSPSSTSINESRKINGHDPVFCIYNIFEHKMTGDTN